MSFLLDTMVVSYFLEARRHDALAGACMRLPCAIAADVKRELEENKTRGNVFARWLESTEMKGLAVFVDSEAEGVLSGLNVERSTSRGSGERASTARAAAEPAPTFVTM